MLDGIDLPDLSHIPGGHSYLAAVIQFLNADHWERSRRVLARHPELLTDGAAAVLEKLIEAATGQGDDEAARYLTLHRDLLALCRQVGVEEAFRRLGSEMPRLGEDIAVDVLEVIAFNTVAVIVDIPERLGEWLDSLREIEQQALDYGDDPMVTLVQAIRALLRGAKPGSLAPPLSGPYRACWESIVKGLEERRSRAVGVDMFDFMASTVLAAARGEPKAGVDWLAFYRDLHRVAEDLDDTPLAALTAATVRLLESGELPPDPGLDGSYGACWERIAAGLRRSV